MPIVEIPANRTCTITDCDDKKMYIANDVIGDLHDMTASVHLYDNYVSNIKSLLLAAVLFFPVMAAALSSDTELEK